jgi:hypothetical protein
MLGKVRGWIGKAIERWRLFWSLDAAIACRPAATAAGFAAGAARHTGTTGSSTSLLVPYS